MRMGQAAGTPQRALRRTIAFTPGGGSVWLPAEEGAPATGAVDRGGISLALIVAAICIVVSVIRSMKGKPADPDVSPSAGIESPLPSADASQAPEISPPAYTATAAPQPTQTAPAIQGTTPTGFTLNREDFTLSAAGQVFQMQANFTPANAQGEVVWKSSDPNVASVSWNGMVTAVASGTATITASVDGLGEKKCIVRCSFQGSAPTSSAAPASTPGSSAQLSLSREDFTLSQAGETWRLKVSGTSSAVTWASSNSAVATVSGDGLVTAVSKGTCQVTATVDGVTLKCIVRCSF